MEKLNRTTAPQAKQYTEKVIQFGEGNFLRAFIEWIIWKTNQKTDFNASVVVVQPIEKAQPPGTRRRKAGGQRRSYRRDFPRHKSLP